MLVAASAILPEWFVMTPGFRWFDDDGELCILLGWEPECESRTDRTASSTVDGETYFFGEYIYVPRMTYMTWHNNSWVSRDLEGTITGTPCPDDHSILGRLMTGNTFKRMNSENA